MQLNLLSPVTGQEMKQWFLFHPQSVSVAIIPQIISLKQMSLHPNILPPEQPPQNLSTGPISTGSLLIITIFTVSIIIIKSRSLTLFLISGMNFDFFIEDPFFGQFPDLLADLPHGEMSLRREDDHFFDRLWGVEARPPPPLQQSQQSEMSEQPKRPKKKPKKSTDRIKNCEVIECPICCLNIKKNIRIPNLECGHAYHIKCLKEWLRRSKTCPMCREQICC